MNLANNYNITGHKHDSIHCQALNTGLYAAAKFYERTIWIASGGDNDNDFAGNYHGLWMSYGRKSGFGGPGRLERGARIWELKKEPGMPLEIKAYTRDHDGAHNKGMGVIEPPSF